MNDYIKILEEQNEHLKEKLSKAESDLVNANKLINSKNLDSDVYTPLDSEIIDGWQLFDIRAGVCSHVLWFHLKRTKKGWFKITEQNYYFTVSCIEKPNNRFNTEFYSYPDGIQLGISTSKMCNAVFYIARQNNFVYIGNKNNCFTVLPYMNPSPTRKKKLVSGKIVIEDV
jgi:hypothetical protein